MHFCRIEHMQRPSAVVSDEVGDIDQRIDGAQSDGAQPLLQPGRRRPIAHPAYQSEGKCRTKRRRRAEIERHLHRAGEITFHRLNASIPQLAHLSSSEIAGDAAHAGAVGAVGGEIDLDDGIVESDPGRVIRPDRRILRKVDDPFVVVGDL